MKNYVLIIVTLVLLTSCSTKKVIHKDTPFTVKEAYFQNWHGGREGARGVKINILAFDLDDKCQLNTVFYLDKQAKLYKKEIDNSIELTANINTALPRDKMLTGNPQHEYGNKAPTKLKYPNLTKTEAVIEYIHKGILKHIKIKLIEKKALFYQ